ncbi:helix-turn-helix domain-containing protein [Myxococcaceae bacterium JPH2]|nr:helix-turn-helix domain-containing protein [Myxococcaceae bacterium JPH2]
MMQTLDPRTCYQSLCARARRFDGLFFVGVSTTGVYCRPICPARTPRMDRCSFYRTAAEAELAGYRACLRCRPELAPGQAPVDSVPRLVAAAVARIDEGVLNTSSVEALAEELGVTARHLRRALEAELGISPVDLAQSRRLALAKQLLHDTSLPLTEVAFASGFQSVRRFNALFRGRFGRPPSALRRAGGKGTPSRSLVLRLDYRPPLDWEALLSFLRARAIPGVEHVSEGEYRRTVRWGDTSGWVVVRHAKARPALIAEVSLSLSSVLMGVASRLRALFDLDAQPALVHEALKRDAVFEGTLRAHPGLRVPGAFDAFELTMRAVLGQQVSVQAATTLSGRLAARWGTPLEDAPGPELSRLFPTAEEVAARTLDEVAALGMPASRANSVLGVARALVQGTVRLERDTDAAEAIAALDALPGIGPWTAHYVAMRALRWPDAFPEGDLALRKALGGVTTKELSQRAESWRPWRAYAAMHLWARLSLGAGG